MSTDQSKWHNRVESCTREASVPEVPPSIFVVHPLSTLVHPSLSDQYFGELTQELDCKFPCENSVMSIFISICQYFHIYFVGLDFSVYDKLCPMPNNVFTPAPIFSNPFVVKKYTKI